jgi:hypothetical protein
MGKAKAQLHHRNPSLANPRTTAGSGGLEAAARASSARLGAHLQCAPLHRLVQRGCVAEGEEYLGGEKDGRDEDLDESRYNSAFYTR